MALTIGQVKAGTLGVAPLVLYPEIYNKLISIYRDDDFMQILDWMGPASPTTNTRYYNYVEDPLTGPLNTTGATITNSGTRTITVAGLPIGTTYVGQVFRMANGLANGRVQTVTTTGTDSYTITSVNATVLTAVVGDIWVAAGNAQEEASSATTPVKWGINSFMNQTQVFRKKVSATDIAKQTKKYFIDDFNGQDGFVGYEQIRGYFLHRAEMAQAYLFGQPGASYWDDIPNATLLGANGNSVQATRGLLSYIASYGQQYALTTLGTFTMGDWETFTNGLDAQYGPDEYVLMGGGPAMNRLYTFLKNLGSAGLNSVRLVINGGEIDANVDQFDTGDRQFSLAKVLSLSNQQIVGTTDVVSKTIYAVPKGMVHAADGRNGEGGSVSKPYLSTRYMAVDNAGLGTAQIGEYHTGMMAKTGPTSEIAEEGVSFYSNAGLEGVSMQKFAAWRVLA